MGNQVWFYLQDGVSDTQIAETNQRITEALKSYPGPKEGENPVLQYGFMSSQDLDDWITDINTNPKSPQAHLKPATHASLRQMFGMYATPGAMAIDTAYTRCPEDLACILADALVQEPLLARISSNGRDFLQKAGYSDDHPLARLIEPRVVVAPALNTNRREPPQGGVATFRGINNSFVCMLYGNVDRPQYMKDDQYEDPQHNTLYHDDQGRAYMLVPLLRLGAQSGEDVCRYYDHASQLLLKVHIVAFGSILYGASTTDKPEAVPSYKRGSTDIIDVYDCLQMLRGLRNKRALLRANDGYAFAKKTLVAKGYDAQDTADTMMAYAATMLAIHHGMEPDEINHLIVENDPALWEQAAHPEDTHQGFSPSR